MYVLAHQLNNLPIMSLQSGTPVGTVLRPLINSANLEVMALYCTTQGERGRQRVVLMRDVRQFASDCVILDSVDDIEDASEIVRLRPAVEANFNPIGRLVVNESGHRLGKVEDYTVNLKTSMVQKLYVHQSLMRSILFNSLVVDRTQIIDVSPAKFTVRDAAAKEPLFSAKTIPDSK
jgi:uncharacterized protein YrrD